MKRSYFVLSFCFICLVSFSQDTTNTTKAHKTPGFEFYISPGIPFPPSFQVTDISGLTHRLKSIGIHSASTNNSAILMSRGIGFSFGRKKILVGLGLYYLSMLKKNDTVDYAGSYSQIYLATNLLKIKNCIISPPIAYGVQKLIAVVTNQSNTTSFNTALTTSSNQSELGIANSMLDFAFNIKKYYPSTSRVRPLLLIGYKTGLKESSWKVKASNINDGPKDKAGTFYIQCVYGFGM